MDYERWCALSDESLRTKDVAELNLITADGLPGADDLNVGALIQKLDNWADLVDFGIGRMWKQCGRGEYREFTPNQFRILIMVTVLQRNLGVQYRPECSIGEYDARDSRDNFLHGPLTGHGGNCVALPFLYVAIGRRLGFPVYVVQAKEHLFVRWDGQGDRFNVEATSLGFLPLSDSYYRNRPKPLSDTDLRSWPRYLCNLTPREELACFIAERAAVFFDNLHFAKAVKAIYFANELSSYYRGRWAVLSMALKMVIKMARFNPKLSWEASVRAAKPQQSTRFEKWAFEQAESELLRVMSIRRPPRHDSFDSVFTSLGMETPYV